MTSRNDFTNVKVHCTEIRFALRNLYHHISSMLTEIYIEPLLVDEELADQVWEVWDKGEIDDDIAWLAWWLMIEHSACMVKV